MAKTKSAFFCRSCGFESPKWIGKCPGCSNWNTLSEEVKPTNSNHAWKKSTRKIVEAKKINEIPDLQQQKLILPDSELNLVLGGGLVSGAVVLLGGEPGIGKSTLLLQLALRTPGNVLYVSGEESESQIKLRAERLGASASNCAILTETLLENILNLVDEHTPDILIIDSIQTIYSDALDATPGSVSQIRDCTGKLLQYAKENNVPVFLVGHITKDGAIAGPKLLEHMVDTVLQFEGDEPLSGIAISGVLEGMRPLLLEVQALVSTAVYGMPQRSATGFDLRRLNMLLAVLEKRCGFRLAQSDVFINLAGGLRLEDPALDLALMASIMSSYHAEPLPMRCVFSGEVGLSGEVRAVQRIEQRISEAEKLGFTDIVLSKYNKIPDSKDRKIKIHTFGRVDEVFSWLFG